MTPVPTAPPQLPLPAASSRTPAWSGASVPSRTPTPSGRGGVPDHLARFAGVRGSRTAAGTAFEDALESLADMAWKAGRGEDPEQPVAIHLATASVRGPWDVCLTLDGELDRIASAADARLACHPSHPIAG